MVTTRAQARRARGSSTDTSSQSDSDDAEVYEVASTDGTPSRPRRVNASGITQATPPKNTIATRSAQAVRVGTSPTTTTGATAAAATASAAVSAEGEKLGRGCRISRSSISLDEQYLAASLTRSSAHQYRNNGGLGLDSTRRGRQEEEEAFATNRRYPQRAAAKRAMESLHNTLTKPNGAASSGGEEEDDHSNSLGAFHFRNHPELGEELKKKHKKQRKQHRRGRGSGRRRRAYRRHRGSDEDDDEDESTAESESSSSDDDTSPSSSSSTSSTSSSSSSDGVGISALPNGRAAPLAASSSAGSPASHPSATSSPRVSGGAFPDASAQPGSKRAIGAMRRTNEAADAVSLDSSISEVSMREESVEREAQQEQRRRRHRHPSASSSSNSDDNGDPTREFATEEERRRAMRQARQSTDQNVNINYYMAGVVGAEDPKKRRRRRLDRRYRALLFEEEEARARADGTGVGSSGSGATGASSTTANGALGDISPLRIDDEITFDSVGGLPEHIVTLREMVLLPLLYPDLFQRLDLQAPRGVLFVGPPGTGKTLMARALAAEGSRFACGHDGNGAAASAASQQRITFFVRKGADMLSKWVGESERQLKLLFEEAKRLQPSIIFFDEVDGLAPTRHAKTEQTQAALVSTLLALLDGLEDRGQVVVIGATNRPDTLDPALRRPGRFDRELVFPLPDAAARQHILTIQLAKKAMPESAEQRAALLHDLVEMTEGYSGADLGALCTEASLHRLRTALPQLYLSSKRLLIPREVEQAQLHVRTEDFYAAAQLMQPSLRRCRTARSADVGFLDPYVEVLLRGTRDATLAALAPSWSLVEQVLRASQRDCRDMVSAVRALCAVPIPQPPRPCLLVLCETAATEAALQVAAHQSQQQTLHLHHLALSLLKGLPGLHQLTVHLPELLWDTDMGDGSAAYASRLAYPSDDALPEDYLGGSASGSGSDSERSRFRHMQHVVQSVRQCSPCVVHLSGVEEWLGGVEQEEGDEGEEEDESDGEKQEEVETGTTSQSEGLHGVDGKPEHESLPRRANRQQRQRQQRARLFRRYMNMLAETDVVFVCPCATLATRELLLLQPQPQPQCAPSASAAHFPKSPVQESQRSSDSAHNTFAPATTSQELFSASLLHSSGSFLSMASPSSPALLADPPTAVQLTRVSARQHLLHPQYSVVEACIAATPLPEDLRHFAEYVLRIVTMTLHLHHSDGRSAAAHQTSSLASSATAVGTAPSEGVAPPHTGRELVLAEDSAALPSSLSTSQMRARRRLDRIARCAVWRKVEYRRLQLRHVLMKWVSQYINSAKFKLLASADLDLAPDDPLFKAWRQHTKHHRLGLQDILEKIEDEKYVCLSQYNDDLDQLVRNVRSFFRTRAAQDQRYRLKALDLKETALLNMYKLNRAVIRFCEEMRDVTEPSASDSEDEESGVYDADGAKRRHGHGSHHRHRDHHHSRADDGDGGATTLVQKSEDPALVAEQSRRAISFLQRPAAAPRKRRREWGQRSRRRRPKTARVATATAKAAEAEPKGDEEEQNADVEVIDGGVEEDNTMKRSATDSAPTTEASAVGLAQPTDAAAHGPASPPDSDSNPSEPAPEKVETRACTLLASFTYPRLYRVFKSMMRGLEVEVRALDDAARLVQQNPEAGLPLPPPAAPPPSTASPDVQKPSGTRDDFVALVFMRLLCTAVEEQK